MSELKKKRINENFDTSNSNISQNKNKILHFLKMTNFGSFGIILSYIKKIQITRIIYIKFIYFILVNKLMHFKIM